MGVWWCVVGCGFLVVGGGRWAVGLWWWLVMGGGWWVVCGWVVSGENYVVKTFFTESFFSIKLFWWQHSFVIHFLLLDNKFICDKKMKKIKLPPFF